MKDSHRVVVLGDANIDILLQLPAYPPLGGEARAEKMTLELGGSAANTAFSLAGLGVETRFVGCLGDDHWAGTVREGLRHAGIDADAVQTAGNSSTGLMLVAVTPDGERTLMGSRGANVWLDPQEMTPAIFTSAAAVHLSGYALIEPPQQEAALRAIELAAESGAWISLDVGHVPAPNTAELIRRMLPRLKILMLGSEASEALIGVKDPMLAVEKLVSAGTKWVGLTRGKAGAILAWNQNRVRIPALPAASVDATGAGDAFAAGMVLSALRDLALGPAAVVAAALGSLATTRWGAGTQMPGLAVLIPFIERQRDQTPKGVEAAWIEQALAGVRSR